MNPILEMVCEIVRCGGSFNTADGRVKIVAPKGAMSTSLIQQLTENKSAVVALIESFPAVILHPDGSAMVATPVSIRRTTYALARRQSFPARYGIEAGEPAWRVFCRDGDEAVVAEVMCELDPTSYRGRINDPPTN